jgi:hypothetical protein
MQPKDITKLAYLLYPHLMTAETGEEIEALAERIKSLQRGLLPEDEFAAIVSWLGNCAAIHKIDQTPMPMQVPPEKIRAPDFIAFPLVEGIPRPVLIEVKSSDDESLDWSEEYLNSLKHFAEYVELPLLIAWKKWGIWTLVDCNHFVKNITAYRLTFNKALQEDLLSVLFRDVRIHMNPILEFILDMDIIDNVAGDAGDLLPEGKLEMLITDAGFYMNGNKIKSDSPFDFALFLATPNETEFLRTAKKKVRHIFRPTPDHGFTLSSVLVSQLTSTVDNMSPNWHQILAKGKFPSSGREFRDALSSSLNEGFVKYVLNIVPHTWPEFVPNMEGSKPR